MHTLKGDLLIKQQGIDYFKQGSTFGALSEESIKFLVEQGKVIQLKPGDQLFNFGDTGDCFYIILKGTVQFSGLFQSEIEYVRNFTFGEALGFVAMISLDSQVGSVEAQGDSIVLEVSSNLFYELHEKLPSDFGILMLNLSREMARRIRGLFIGNYELKKHE